ncbi:Jag family protein [Dermatobacter hominis]|uniref:Jag family protein n=1 Tax=Dermatobacter hominis TaxID=2884263 RepID=UPI001D11A3E6|nr:R3H domain-containing nucleic acid-binding protein [Dermatobacter hominis]UDY34349.1 Jag N-terminal domain-containing protein [Dermatobacter hominis]
MSATVEWVETTGKTVEEAKEAALDRLGVDEQDAEFEVIEEPRSGLFGRTRGVGRVRARVVPRAPRPKPERRKRSRSGGRSGGAEETRDESGSGGQGGRSRQRNRSGGRNGQGDGRGKADDGRNRADAEERTDAGADKDAAPTSGGGGRERNRSAAPQKEREVMDEAAQCEAVTTFLDGLGQAFGLEVTSTATIEGDVLRASIEGSEVGLFIGPNLGTLEAIQEIARNVLQRHADGREHAKVVLDVSGVRELRRTKLAAFVTEAAQQVKDDGVELAFEVMSSPDRKVVHDTVAEIEGVESTSIGEDPRRRVVLKPA